MTAEPVQITDAMRDAFYEATTVTREGTILNFDDGLRAAVAALAHPPAQGSEARVEALEAVLRNIAYMDCYTREGEEPIHLLMMRQAKAALQQEGE